MTRAEAEAAVIAAVWRAYPRHARECRCGLCRAVDLLTTLPPDDTVDVLGVPVPREVHEARALAWATGDWVCFLRNAYREEWNIAFEAGWWPTRDAEHAQHAGTYWVDTQRGGGQTDDGGRSATVPTATPAPSGSEGMAGGEVCDGHFYRFIQMPEGYLKPISGPWRCERRAGHGLECGPRDPNDTGQLTPAPEQSAAPVPELADIWKRTEVLNERLLRLETAIWGHECAGPKELSDSARLDALAHLATVVAEEVGRG